jgi:hypothetical protein
MSLLLNLPEGAAAAAGVGTKLQAEAKDFKTKARQLLADIQQLDQGRPWGGDEAGKTFEEQYHKPAGEAGPLAHALQSRLETAGDLLDKVGGKVVQAASQYERADVTGAADIAGAV